MSCTKWLRLRHWRTRFISFFNWEKAILCMLVMFLSEWSELIILHDELEFTGDSIALNCVSPAALRWGNLMACRVFIIVKIVVARRLLHGYDCLATTSPWVSHQISILFWEINKVFITFFVKPLLFGDDFGYTCLWLFNLFWLSIVVELLGGEHLLMECSDARGRELLGFHLGPRHLEVDCWEVREGRLKGTFPSIIIRLA